MPLPSNIRLALASLFCTTLPAAPPPQTTPRQPVSTLSFDVASVHQNNSGGPPRGDYPESNVPLGPGNVYTPTGGLFSVKNYTLLSYIAFAYRMTDAQLSTFREMAPPWVADDRFNIQARTDRPDLSKDDLRLMVRSLLEERFKLAIHYESRSVSVYDLTLARPGITGPHLRPHPPADLCPTEVPKSPAGSATPPAETVMGGFPTTCGGVVWLTASAPQLVKIGGRNLSIGLLAGSMTGWGALNRPVIDKTGLHATYDFILEFAPEAQASAAPDQPALTDLGGPTFQQALKQQLGLKLDSRKGEVAVILLDHIEPLHEN